MKKYFFGFFAVALAFGLSAFSSSKASLVDFYYLDGSNWEKVPTGITVCPSGSVTQCSLEIEDEQELIYTQPNVAFPHIRN